MAQIRHSDSYKILSKDEQVLQQLKVDTEAERLANEKLIKVAKKLKSMGMAVEDIKKATGLRVGEIRKLLGLNLLGLLAKLKNKPYKFAIYIPSSTLYFLVFHVSLTRIHESILVGNIHVNSFY